MATPTAFNNVSLSPKNHDEIIIVDTSFPMPAIDIGTTPARWMMLIQTILELQFQSNIRTTSDVLVFAQNHAEGYDTRRRQK